MSKTYAVSGDTTEWEDILIKKGITTKEDVLMAKRLNPEDFVAKTVAVQSTKEEVFLEKMCSASVDELREMEDDEDSDSRMLSEYRLRRIEELKQARLRNRFGDVCEIVKDEWVREVTECSASCWVIVHLYQDFVTECRVMEAALQNLATRFKYVKFLKIRSTQAVENWPEHNLPTLFIYNQGELKLQLITLKTVGGKAMNPSDLEWWLASRNVITTSELEEDPRASGHSRKQVSRVGISASRMSSLGSDDEDEEGNS